MKKQKINLLLKTIISALLFSLSFLFTNYVGFFIIPSIFLLFLILQSNVNNNRNNTIISIKKTNIKYYISLYSISLMEKLKKIYFWNLGLIWGAIVFLLHGIWFYQLLINKSEAGWFWSISLYMFIIIYGSILSGLFFYITGLISSYFNNIFAKLIVILVTFTIYINFIINYFLFFISKNFGYPFFNPLIPLARYKIFLFLFSILNLNFNSNNDYFFEKKYKIIYLKPIKAISNHEVNAQTAALLIYNQISDMNLLKEKKKIIIVSPETFYPYALNKNKYAIKLWGNVIPVNAVLFLGSQRKVHKRNYQTIYQIESCRIINFYDKIFRIPFVEKIPKKFKKNHWFKKIFLNKKTIFNKGDVTQKSLFTYDFSIEPFICSDFFYKINKMKTKSKFSLVIVNDSWFIKYFKTLMKYFVLLQANHLGINILYVNHYDYKFIKAYSLQYISTL